MKAIYLTFFIIIPFISFSQIIDDIPSDENGNIVFSEVVNLDSLTKETLYLNSKQYFVDAFKSANNVIQMDDKEASIIIGKGFSDINYRFLGMVTVKMWYSIKIQSKEGRFKYDIYDIYFECYENQHVLPNGYVQTQTADDIFVKDHYYKKNGIPLKTAVNVKDAMFEKIGLIKESIKNGMKKMISNNDDW